MIMKGFDEPMNNILSLLRRRAVVAADLTSDPLQRASSSELTQTLTTAS